MREKITRRRFIAGGLILGLSIAQSLKELTTTQPASLKPLSQNYYKPELITREPVEIGFNVTGITHFGYRDILPYSKTSDVDTHLKAIRDTGGTVIRVFAPNDQITNAEASRRLGVFLDKAKTYNISAIVSFINYYDAGGFKPQGTQRYYTDIWNGIPLLGDEFFTGGYKNEYLPFVQTVISENKDRTNIHSWQPGNELKYVKDPSVFIGFMHDTTSIIRDLDPGHPISAGMLSAAHTGLSPSELYPNLPNVDIITIHAYNRDRSGDVDADWAVANGKKAILSEIGFSGIGDRSPQMDAEIQFWRNKNISTVLQWGFIAKGLPDNGNGDRVYGMDTIWHTDYDQLVTTLQKWKSLTGNIPLS